MELSPDFTYRLNNGSEIPRLGLGVFQNPKGESTVNAVKTALETGYRHIDTASIYGNEKSVGEAVQASNLPRKDIFITTKLWNSDHGYDRVMHAFKESLHQLNVKYIDLYLIHWPVYGLRVESYNALETIYESGKCQAIGVSNYMIKHLKELMKFCGIKPAVNQIEISPYNYKSRLEVINFCKDNDIAIEAYSPLTKGIKLKDEKLKAIAGKYEKTTAQLLIRWSLQHNFIVLAKSANPGRIAENKDVFDFTISDEDMKTMDSFDENLVTGWNPVEAP